MMCLFPGMGVGVGGGDIVGTIMRNLISIREYVQNPEIGQTNDPAAGKVKCHPSQCWAGVLENAEVHVLA